MCATLHYHPRFGAFTVINWRVDKYEQQQKNPQKRMLLAKFTYTRYAVQLRIMLLSMIALALPQVELRLRLLSVAICLYSIEQLKQVVDS